jgi:hypothetical protein
MLLKCSVPLGLMRILCDQTGRGKIFAGNGDTRNERYEAIILYFSTSGLAAYYSYKLQM